MSKKSKFAGRDFISLFDFSTKEVWEIFKLAKAMKANPKR
jgi:ornithine carbamoyltransferase